MTPPRFSDHVDDELDHARGMRDLDLATGALKLCPHSRRMFGLSPDSSELLTESEWNERFHPDDLAVVRQALTACLVHRSPYAERFRTIHPDGNVQMVLGVGRAVEQDGEPAASSA